MDAIEKIRHIRTILIAQAPAFAKYYADYKRGIVHKDEPKPVEIAKEYPPSHRGKGGSECAACVYEFEHKKDNAKISQFTSRLQRTKVPQQA